jgi:hypothetical protein
MQELIGSEIALVAGADAAATRGPGTNSWGETAAAVLERERGECLTWVGAAGGGALGAIYCLWHYH